MTTNLAIQKAVENGNQETLHINTRFIPRLVQFPLDVRELHKMFKMTTFYLIVIRSND